MYLNWERCRSAPFRFHRHEQLNAEGPLATGLDVRLQTSARRKRNRNTTLLVALAIADGELNGFGRFIDRLKVALEASFADNQPFPHTLLLGPPGLGKTSLAKLVARELAAPFYEGLGQSLSTPAVLNGFLLKPTEDHAVLFIDEIHELNRAGQTALYRAMEERVVFLTNQYSDSVTKLQAVVALAATRLRCKLRGRMATNQFKKVYP